MLKVMTLNLNYYGDKHGAWRQRRDLVQAAIQAAEPDVIALQAVRQDLALYEGQDQASQLAELLPVYRHVRFREAMPAGNDRVDGSALLSTLPITELEVLPLSLQSGLEDTNRRIVMRARLELPDGPVYLFNAHFSWVTSQALANVAETLPFLNSVAGPALMVGDLNATPETEAMRQLAQAGWIDSWAAAHPAQDGYTFEADRPTIRIDYAWLNRDLSPHLHSIDIITAPPEAGARLSDHLSLLVALDL